MKTILLIGLGRFGMHIAMKLYEMGHEIMAIDKCEERVNSALPYVTSAQIGDSTNEEFMRSLGVRDYDVCIVAISGDFQCSLETTALLKELDAQLVVSRAERDVQAKFLGRNGADEVLYPEKQVAEWVAIRYGTDHILDYIDLGDESGIFEVTIPDSWVGKSISQLDIRKKYRVSIVALKTDEKLRMAIQPETVFEQDMTLLVMGTHRDVRKCFNV